MADNEIITLDAGRVCKTLFIMSEDNPFRPSGDRAGDFGILAAGSFVRKIILKDNAYADMIVLALPGADVSLDFRIELAGYGAGCSLCGLYLCPDHENVRINVELDHKVPHCVSDQLFKGIVSGTARAGFYGRIVVDRDAQKTEVKCSHGATIGKLDEQEQFYMRSRGIPEKEAKVLQMLSFLSPVLDRLPEGETRDSVAAYVENVIRLHF